MTISTSNYNECTTANTLTIEVKLIKRNDSYSAVTLLAYDDFQEGYYCTDPGQFSAIYSNMSVQELVEHVLSWNDFSTTTDDYLSIHVKGFDEAKSVLAKTNPGQFISIDLLKTLMQDSMDVLPN